MQSIGKLRALTGAVALLLAAIGVIVIVNAVSEPVSAQDKDPSTKGLMASTLGF